MNIGKPKRKWKIYQLKEDDAGRYAEEIIGWLLECEDYVLFRPLDAAKIGAVCSGDEVESHSLKDAARVVLEKVKLNFKTSPRDVFSMAQPEVVF